jgi:hypothetical protein
MKEKYKQLVIAKYGNPYEWLKQKALDTRQSVLEQLESNLKIENRHYDYFQKFCKKTKAYAYAKVCAWLELALAVKGANCKAWGFEGKNNFLEQLAEYLKNKALPVSLGSKQMIQRRVRMYKNAKKKSEEEALESVLDGRSNNQNPRKVHEEQINCLIALMSSPKKPPVSTVTALYNRKAKEMGWKKISKRTALNYLESPECKKKWYLRRHGKKATYNKLEISTLRENASAPNALWIMDGTPVDLYYKSRDRRYNDDIQDYEWKQTKWNRVNMFCIMDAHSWKIIGYHISDRENHVAVIEGLRDAARNTMQLPVQMMYDQSSANKKVKNVLDEMARYNTANKPYRAKPKSLEAMFGHFQQKMLRYHDNWAGQNITAKKLDSRVNPEALNMAMKNLPDREQLEKDIALLVATWNELATETREKPNYLYSNKKSKGKSIDWLTFSNLFFVVTQDEYKYQAAGGIRITIAKEQYNFQTWNQELHYSMLVNQKFQIAYDPDTMEYIYLYKNNKPVLDERGEPVLIPRLEKLPMAIADYEDEKGTKVREYVNAQNEGTELLEKWAKETDEAVAAMALELSPQYVYKEAYNRAEENLKRQQAEDESQGADWEDLFDNPYKV